MHPQNLWKLRAALALFLGASVVPVAVAQTTTTTDQQEEETTIKLERFEVTGSRLSGATAEGTLSVSLYKMDAPENIGYSNIGDLLRRKLPQFGGGIGTVNEGFGNGGSGQSTVSLRNLPLSRTLFLVNGRRFNGDINMIPAVGIDRVEVLNDGASPIYGSEAVAGVVNVILKRGYEGGELRARYANTTTGDVGEARFGFVYGGKTNNDRTSFTLAMDWNKRNLMMTPERAVSLPSGDSVSGTSNPGLFTPNSTAAQRLAANATISGDPGHVAGVTNVNILVPLRWFVDTPGTVLTSASQIPSAFNPTAFLTLPSSMSTSARNAARDAEEIARNALLPSGSPVRYGPNKVLLPGLNPGFPFGYLTYGFRPQEGAALSFTSETKITDDLSVIFDVQHARNESENALAASPLSGRTVAATNYWYQQVFPAASAAGNSFGFGYRPTEIGSRVTFNKFEETTITAGLKGTINDRWRYTVTYNRDEWRLHQRQTGGVISTAFNTALASSSSTAAFNPFGFTPLFSTTSPAHPLAFWSSMTGSADSVSRALYELGEVVVGGNVWELPAGDIEASVGVEYRREETKFNPDQSLRTGAIFPFNIVSGYDLPRRITSYYAESNVPIFRSLSLSLAARNEDFDDVGQTGWKPRVAFRWEALPGQVTVRGSWAKGFVAPGVTSLTASAPTQSFQELFNPLTNVRTQPTQGVILIGNPGLQPLDSDSKLFGVVYSPKAVKGLTVGLNYYRIEEEGIPFTSAQYIVNQWFAAGPDNTSNPYGPNASPSAENPLGARVILNIDGSLRQVTNVGPINSGQRLTDGLDFFANYTRVTSMGDWSLNASWTKVMTFEQENFPGAGSIDYLGYYWPSGSALGNYGFPVWKGSLSAAWSKGRYSASIGYNYVDGYDENNGTTTTADDRSVEAYATLDIRIGYKIPFIEAQLTVGSNNVTDEQPPKVLTSFENQYDRAIADLRGRMLFVELSKRF